MFEVLVIEVVATGVTHQTRALITDENVDGYIQSTMHDLYECVEEGSLTAFSMLPRMMCREEVS